MFFFFLYEEYFERFSSWHVFNRTRVYKSFEVRDNVKTSINSSFYSVVIYTQKRARDKVASLRRLSQRNYGEESSSKRAEISGLIINSRSN